uniref:Zinc finger PHD-type domain-containing protein n=1 Tax=Cyanoptyche gloeocystis TaxID=77922 RepID=A0A7S2JJW8_9EUKA|mmetsp:Transcript_1275/g.2430  ORF Transcript_1275/g.2430 Transcript_1275/m.2430 type:complete len:873 (+) Transcript_1275:45-2663(+)|eukprot:CAMPEP_0196663252 /NCGR_PEP_ID=MMETSP1086-20130531/52101_1 /TAXON_ID=77921 /ORGANISM="Cyanoptyche  gloeocystis , Strain SAG4.97" /LENGTH=872 /DNA_ID=CAMNT_0041998995 /DNA_START=38 /DNA_END=2656 /DNA_ORIENTATION=+
MANQVDVLPEINLKACRPSCKFTITDLDASNIIRVKLRNKSSSGADGNGEELGEEKCSPAKKARKPKSCFRSPIDHPDFKLLPESYQRWLIRIVALGRSNSKKPDWQRWLTSNRPRRDRKLPAVFSNGDYEFKAQSKNSDCWCFVCGDGGTLLICDERSCKKVFHASCIPEDETRMNTGRKWVCPRHRCGYCPEDGSPTLIFQCETCVYSRCRSHLDLHCVVASDAATSDHIKSPRVICPLCQPPLLAKGISFRPVEDLFEELDKHDRTLSSGVWSEQKSERNLMGEKRQFGSASHDVDEPEPFAVKKPRREADTCHLYSIPVGKRTESSSGMEADQSLDVPSSGGICLRGEQTSEFLADCERHRHTGNRSTRLQELPAEEMASSRCGPTEDRPSPVPLRRPDVERAELRTVEKSAPQKHMSERNDVAFQSHPMEDVRPPSEPTRVAVETTSRPAASPTYHGHFPSSCRPEAPPKFAIKSFPAILRRRAPRDLSLTGSSKQAPSTSPRSGRKRITKPSYPSPYSTPPSTIQILVPSTPASPAGFRAASLTKPAKKSPVLRLTPRTVSLFASHKPSLPPVCPPDLPAEQLPAELRGSLAFSPSPSPPCVPVQSSLSTFQLGRPSGSDSANSLASSSRSSPTPMENGAPNSNSNSNSNSNGPPALITSSKMRVAVMAKMRKKRGEALLSRSCTDAAFSEDAHESTAGPEHDRPASDGSEDAESAICASNSNSNSNSNPNSAADPADPDFDVDCFWACGNDESAGDAPAPGLGSESESEPRDPSPSSRSASDAERGPTPVPAVASEDAPLVNVATPEAQKERRPSSSPLSPSPASSCAGRYPESFSPAGSIRTGPCSPSDLSVDLPGPMVCRTTA